jgi:hemerythrin
MTTALSPTWEALREDHLRVHRLSERLKSSDDLPAMVSVLEELNAALVTHFAHEEEPEGLYDVVSVHAPQYKTPLGNLVNEHYRILAEVRELSQKARELLERSHEDLRGEAQRLADLLMDHESREDEIAEIVLRDSGGQ